MARRVTLTALSIAISGLLIIALISTMRPFGVEKKSSHTGLFPANLNDGWTEGAWMDEAPRRLSRQIDPAGKRLEEALKGQREFAEGERRGPASYDPALMVSVASVVKRFEAKEELMVLVDVREHSAFVRCHIPGSINVPLHAVKTKTFLRSTPLVLVDDGFPCERLEDQCRRLRASGFMSWLLEGGLNAWREAGAPMEGEQVAQHELNRLSPQRLFEGKDHEHWVAIDVRGRKGSNERLPFARVIAPGLPESAAVFVAPIAQLQKKAQEQPPVFFVVFNEDGKQYEEVEQTLTRAGRKNAFYLKGGVVGYNAFLEQSRAVFEKDDQSRRTFNKCSGCP